MTGRAWSKNFVSHYKCKEASPSTNSAGEPCWNKHLNAKRLDATKLAAVRNVARHPSSIEIAYQTYHGALNNEFNQAEYENIKQELTNLTKEEIATAKAQVQGIAAGASTGVYEALLRVGIEENELAIQT
jgi:hypothetical protein